MMILLSRIVDGCRRYLPLWKSQIRKRAQLVMIVFLHCGIVDIREQGAFSVRIVKPRHIAMLTIQELPAEKREGPSVSFIVSFEVLWNIILDHLKPLLAIADASSIGCGNLLTSTNDSK